MEVVSIRWLSTAHCHLFHVRNYILGRAAFSSTERITHDPSSKFAVGTLIIYYMTQFFFVVPHTDIFGSLISCSSRHILNMTERSRLSRNEGDALHII